MLLSLKYSLQIKLKPKVCVGGRHSWFLSKESGGVAVALLAGDEGSKVMDGTEDKRRTEVNRVVGVSHL